MPNFFLCSISKSAPGNWDICKAHGLWGLARHDSIARSLSPGDQMLVWVGGQGFIAVIEATTGVLPVAAGEDPAEPWNDGKEYRHRFRFALRREYSTPKSYGFVNNRNPETGLMTIHLQRSLNRVDETLFTRLLTDLEAVNAAPGQMSAQTRHAGQAPAPDEHPTGFSHDLVQRMLVELGLIVSCDVWVPRNNRRIEDASVRLLEHLPRLGFDEETTRIIENIDVLWLKGNRIVCAFEVEHTTSVYSGLLRLSDLLTVQPNISIELYIVAALQRRGEVERQVSRPTFRSRLRMPDICRFVSYEKLRETLDGANRFSGFLDYGIVRRMAESLAG